jgi:hypothetical protein
MNDPCRKQDPPAEDHMKERAVPMERHIQTLIGAVLIGLVFWMGTTLNNTSTGMAVLDERVATLTGEVTALRTQVANGIDDRYRKTDASRDLARVWNHFAAVDDQLDELERRIESAHP